MSEPDPTLALLRPQLERLGYTVVPHGAHLCVRLPLFTSVQLHSDGGRLQLRAQFGPFGRTAGLLTTSGVATAVLGGAVLTAGLGPLAALVAFLGVVGLAHDACRFVVTEGAMTRLQLLATHAMTEAGMPIDPRVRIGQPRAGALPPMPAERVPQAGREGEGSRPPSRRTLP